MSRKGWRGNVLPSPDAAGDCAPRKSTPVPHARRARSSARPCRYNPRMADRPREVAQDLCAFIDAAPTPFHACAEIGRRLERAGFQRLPEAETWRASAPAGRHYTVRGGSIAAWVAPQGHGPARGWRIAGAHTDSPNLRVKPRPDTGRAGMRQLGVEVYGGVLLNSWLDRDLALAGRAYVRGERGTEERLFALQRPILRIPQLAIHLNREITTEGLLLNPQLHLNAVRSEERRVGKECRSR